MRFLSLVAVLGLTAPCFSAPTPTSESTDVTVALPITAAEPAEASTTAIITPVITQEAISTDAVEVVDPATVAVDFIAATPTVEAPTSTETLAEVVFAVEPTPTPSVARCNTQIQCLRFRAAAAAAHIALGLPFKRQIRPSSLPAAANPAASTVTFTPTGIRTTYQIAAGRYNFAAYGAVGGISRAATGNGQIAGGRAANVNVTITFPAAAQLNLVVGRVGGSASPANGGGGGGGGTFVYTNKGVPIVVAGGGGGASHNGVDSGTDASLSTSGNRGRAPNSLATAGNGGINGLGGTSSTSGATAPGGGAGYNGQGLPTTNQASGIGRDIFTGGKAATVPAGTTASPGAGGFGGGGGGSAAAGGGGGGYSGGGAGAAGQGGSGGGGGSYADSTLRTAGTTVTSVNNYGGEGKILIFGPY